MKLFFHHVIMHQERDGLLTSLVITCVLTFFLIFDLDFLFGLCLQQTDCKINFLPLPIATLFQCVFTVSLIKRWSLFSHHPEYGLTLCLLCPTEYGRSVDVPVLSLETLCASTLSEPCQQKNKLGLPCQKMREHIEESHPTPA